MSGSASVLLFNTLRSSTFRLALIAIAVFGAVVIGLFTYVYQSTAAYILGGSDRAIEAERTALLKAYDGAGRDGLVEAIRQHVADGRLADGFYLLTDPSDKPVAGNLDAWPPGLSDEGERGDVRSETRVPGSSGEGFLLRAKSQRLPDGSHLLVGLDVGDLDRFRKQIYAAIAIAITLIFVLAAVTSVSVTRRTVGRIDAINMTSRAIMKSGLGKRIPLRGSGDEWDQLARNLNLMLERIESLMGEVKQVADNVAHDLRTPLTRMRARLEKASIKEGRRNLDQSLISDTIADLDVVLRMFSSLTRISQIESTHRTAAFRAVDICDVSTQVAELFDAAAEDKGTHLDVVCDGPVFIKADRDLLFDALANLVDNAIKHGRDKGRVTIGVDRNHASIAVFVSDDGPGIPAHECRNVFKRFYRLEQSRQTPGNGLGLSLVAAVANLHGAQIAMIDNAPGLRIEMRFDGALPRR